MLMERIHQEADTLGLVKLTSDVSRTAEPFFRHYRFWVVEKRFPVLRAVEFPNALMRKDLCTQ